MKRAQAWSEQAEVFIVIGSSLQVQPAASFPVIAKRSGALLAIINRDETPLDELADFIHRGAIGEFFEKLSALLDACHEASWASAVRRIFLVCWGWSVAPPSGRFWSTVKAKSSLAKPVVLDSLARIGSQSAGKVYR